MRIILTLPLLGAFLLAPACDPTLGDLDLDGDGFTPDAGDCDDSRADVHPGAEEVCDGVQNNCGAGVVTDERGDLDEDGVSICDGDCNDEQPNIYPLAPEACDGVDQDCDGSESPEWDADRDGYVPDEDAGGPQGCDPAPYRFDCDDDDPAVHYGAEDVPGLPDADCDGNPDEASTEEVLETP